MTPPEPGESGCTSRPAARASHLAIATTTARVLADDAAVHLVHVATSEAPVARQTEGPEFGVEWTARFAALKRAIADSAITEMNGIVLRGGEPAARPPAASSTRGRDSLT